MRSILLSLLITIVCPVIAHAGATRLVVVDDKNEPVAGATVSIISENDSTLLFAAITDADGSVSLPDEFPSTATVAVRSIGFEPLDVVWSPSLHKVSLSEATKQLAEVTVTMPPAALTQKAGKFILDPGVLKTKSTDCLDLLRISPLLSVSHDGVVSILGVGKSFIYINGQEPIIPQSAVIEQLKSLPPSRIKRVEIITSPGSQYSASMTGGIVNVVLTKLNEGFIGSASLRGNYVTERGEGGASFWGGYSKSKFKLGLSLQYSNNNRRSSEDESYDYVDINRQVNNLVRSSSFGNSLSASLNASCDLTKRSLLAFAVNLGSSNNNGYSDILSNYVDNGVIFSDYSHIENGSPWIRPSWGISGYYSLSADDRGSGLTVKVNYSNRKSIDHTDYFFGDDPAVRQSTDVGSYGWAVKPMYTHIFNDRHRMEAGYQLNYGNINNEYLYPGQDNNFLYKEMINSGFAEWDAQWSNKFNTRLGLRVENTDTKGVQRVGNDSFKRNYTDLIPSLNIGLTLPGRGNSLSFGLSRFLYRPFYENLNPFVYYSSETTCRKGNPNLRSSPSWNYRIYYRFLNGFSLSANYDFQTATLSDYTYRDGETTVTSTGNFGKSKQFRAVIEYYKSVYQWWTFRAQAYASYQNTHAVIDNDNVGVNQWSWSASLSHYFNVVIAGSPLNFGLDYGFTPATDAITRHYSSRHRLSFNASKRFMKNRMSVSLYISNILNSKANVSFRSPTYSYYRHDNICGLSAYLTVSYAFGNFRVRGAEDRYESDLDNRFKN